MKQPPSYCRVDWLHQFWPGLSPLSDRQNAQLSFPTELNLADWLQKKMDQSVLSYYLNGWSFPLWVPPPLESGLEVIEIAEEIIGGLSNRAGRTGI